MNHAQINSLPTPMTNGLMDQYVLCGPAIIIAHAKDMEREREALRLALWMVLEPKAETVEDCYKILGEACDTLAAVEEEK